MRWPTALLVVVLSPAVARAGGEPDDPYDVPLSPRPPTLPELTHRDDEVSGETTLGVVTPNVVRAIDYNSSEVGAVIQRAASEIPMGRQHRWFLGATYEVAAGSPPGGGAFKFAPGNVDLYARWVWATPTGLTFGGGAGVYLPTAQFGATGDAASVAAAAQAIRPWDEASFLNDTTTFQAFIDARDVDGSFVLQFREGLEGSVTLDGRPGRLAAIAQAYVGYRVIPLLGVGLEAFETYLIAAPGVDTPQNDGRRATFTVSPSIRLMTPYVQPAIGFATAVGTPLFDTVDGFWALRFGAAIVWDPATKRVPRAPSPSDPAAGT